MKTDILVSALNNCDFLAHHGVIGQKWGVRRYQNPDGSLTDEGRRRYLREGSEERVKVDKAAANYADATYKLNNAAENYINKQQRQKFKELRADKRLSNVSDRHLYDYYMDGAYDIDKAKDHVLSSNKKLASEVYRSKQEYDNALRKMYDSVKDTTLDKIKVDKKQKDAYQRFVDLYENERIIESYKRMYGDDWSEHYKDVFK